MTPVARFARRRPLWITAPLYAVLLAVAAVDGWAADFWLRVGGSLGLAVGGAAVLVTVVALLLLVTDGRRQWLLAGAPRGADPD